MEDLPIQAKPSKIPIENVYKVHILNEEGNVYQVYVFCAGLLSEKDYNTLFSDIELSFYKANDVNIIFSNLLILNDDTIRDIKHKIVREITETSKKNKQNVLLSVEEVYMFALKEKYLDMIQLYQTITENDTKKLTKERFFQYATNISIDPYVLDLGERDKGGLYNDIFTYEQWISLTSSTSKEVYVPVGMEFQENYDFLFPTNPFKNQLWTEPVRYKYSSKNPLLTMEKSVLLDYTSSKDIMVCLAKSTLDYAESSNINTSYFCELYFPFLYKQGLTSKSLLLESALALSEDSRKKYDKSMERQFDISQLYREIYWSKKTELSYVEKGIYEFSVVLQANDKITNFPLDLLFRNINTTPQIPFIKYNPGNRRENMYRLYSNSISMDGKKIPLLDESLVMKLSREIGKAKQISMYVQDSINFVIIINNNSQIEVKGTLLKLLSMNELNRYLLTVLDPILSKLNSILQISGYTLKKFVSIDHDNIVHCNLTYRSILPIETKMNLSKQLDYITPIFNVLSSDVSNGANLRFKRIKNFKVMNAKSALIREIYDKTNNSDLVIQGLMDNFELSQEEAVMAFAEFRSQYQLLKQRVIENPGFKTLFVMKPLKSELMVEVKDIHSPKYIPELEMYVDVILRMSQNPKTIGLSAAKLKKFKTKEIKVREVAEEVETIVAPVVQETEMYEALKFSPEEQLDDAQGMDFDDADYYDDYEEGDLEEEDEEMYGGEQTPEEKYQTNIDGMAIKNPSPFFKRMLELDPTLFVTEESSKFPLYSKACPSSDKRQPVILTDDEKKRIDETNPGSYSHALHYGSSEGKKHWYICPRYWCLKTNSSISEKDVQAGKCGAIIPPGSDKVPPGAYVYEFNNPKVHMKDGKYVEHVPGFLKKGKHPDGLCAPCCFGKSWNSQDQVKRRQDCGLEEGLKEKEDKPKKEPTQTNKTMAYIIGSVSYPLPPKRWGFMPMALQIFFKSDASQVVDSKNTSVIKSGEKCLLRYGVEKSENQSFLACFAHFYAYKQQIDNVPSLEGMRTFFVNGITLDMFVRYHNGNLVSTFKTKTIKSGINVGDYDETDFYKTINIEDSTQNDYLLRTISSFENFKEFILNEKSIIDHTYLWDFFCDRNTDLLKDGMNLIILQMSDNDITERVQLICPSSAYSRFNYDERKETAIIIKQDNFYEPIHLYEQHESIIISKTNEVVYELKKGDHYSQGKVFDKSNNVVHSLTNKQTNRVKTVYKIGFIEQTTFDEIREILELIKATSKKYCKPMASLPKKYNFKHNINIVELIRLLKTIHYKVEYQVLNYRNKAIGVRVKKEEDDSLLFVPCFPSAMVKNLDTIYMDSAELWVDYRQTRNRLNGLSVDSRGKILSKPSVKIIEDGLVVGFLTETNQFVQINPPTQPIDKDGIEEIKHSSYSYNNNEKNKSAEKALTTQNESSIERIQIIRNINLESEFYNIFRTMVRIQLNQYENRAIRTEIVETIDDPLFSYRGKLKHVVNELKSLLKAKIMFKEFSKEDLDSIDKVILCDENCKDESKPKYCLLSDDEHCVTLFPKKHLLSDGDNENIYYLRMADELIRYNRSRLFMFQPNVYMNITDTEYSIKNNELFLLESRLTRDYFRNLLPYNSDSSHNIGYDSAQPDSEYSGSIQNYTNKIDLEEQSKMLEKTQKEKKEEIGMKDFIVDCIEHTKPNVIGNNKGSSWRIVFPNTAKEIFFNKTFNCSFIPIIYVFQEVYFNTITIQNIKTALWKGYQDLFKNKEFESKIYSLLKQQGKVDMFNKIKTRKTDFETILFSDDYYITDLDLWVFCTVAKLPIVLISSTSLKSLVSSVNWVKLGGRNIKGEKYFFIRSPADVKNNTPPAYHIIDNGYSFNELKNDMFIKAERGDQEYANNIQSIVSFLSKTTLISRIKKVK